MWLDAIYKLVDGENGGAARFAFWEDRRPLTAFDKAMVDALGNASDDEILKLMKDVDERRISNSK